MLRKAVAIDRECAAGRHFMRIGGGEDERVEPPHLTMQDADRARLRIVGAERIGADEFSEIAGLMRGRHADGAHFVQYDGQAVARDLPGRLRSCQSRADDVDGAAHRRGSTSVFVRPSLAVRSAAVSIIGRMSSTASATRYRTSKFD